jgi:hypothetical protein
MGVLLNAECKMKNEKLNCHHGFHGWARMSNSYP